MFLPNIYLVLFALLAVGQIALAVYLWKTERDFLRRNETLWHRTVHKTREDEAKITSGYEDQLHQVDTRMEKDLAGVIAAAQQEYGKFLSGLQKNSAAVVDDAMTGFTKRLEEKMTAVEDQILKLAQEETIRVKLEAQAYRQKMLALTDQDVVEVLDRVIKTLIGKQLSSQDQTQLISQALDDAKKDKFI
ncbi:MAG: hypothetical protein M1484_04340 [Patescibacteria group bacterium]|nr:hypothetical protein [Patescibacteria group bacterium]MCL5432289.1 hypothetical protein [Patescibacteria group bacterium]